MAGVEPLHPNTVREDQTDLELITQDVALGGELSMEVLEAVLLKR